MDANAEDAGNADEKLETSVVAEAAAAAAAEAAVAAVEPEAFDVKASYIPSFGSLPALELTPPSSPAAVARRAVAYPRPSPVETGPRPNLFTRPSVDQMLDYELAASVNDDDDDTVALARPHPRHVILYATLATRKILHATLATRKM